MTEQEIRQACLDQCTEKYDTYEEWAASHSSQIVHLIRRIIIGDYNAVDV